MKTLREKALTLVPAAIFATMAMWLFYSVVFVRFVHYHSQCRVLPTDSYDCELVTPEDYAKLADRSLSVVRLADGSRVTQRTAAFYRSVLPQYKPVAEGRYYVLVKTRGTAHFASWWLAEAIPLLIWCLVGLAAALVDLRRRAADEPKSPPVSEA